jgi:hypothetical protein
MIREYVARLLESHLYADDIEYKSRAQRHVLGGFTEVTYLFTKLTGGRLVAVWYNGTQKNVSSNWNLQLKYNDLMTPKVHSSWERI